MTWLTRSEPVVLPAKIVDELKKPDSDAAIPVKTWYFVRLDNGAKTYAQRTFWFVRFRISRQRVVVPIGAERFFHDESPYRTELSEVCERAVGGKNGKNTTWITCWTRVPTLERPAVTRERR